MLKWHDVTQHKSLSAVQVLFVGAAKQVIVDLEMKKYIITPLGWVGEAKDDEA